MSNINSQHPRQGQYLPTPRGYKAFEPSSLPININLSREMQLLLEKANIAIGSLNSLQSVLPSAELLVRPYAVREALLSSEIEGTQSTLTDVLGEDNNKSDNIEIREVQNYEKAIGLGIKRLIDEDFPLSLRLIKDIHSQLMCDVRGGESIITPGEFRTGQNWIGGKDLVEALYIPCSPERLLEHLDNLENYFYENDLPCLLKAALIHYQFETIHPFNDGNGRIGRILITLYLVHKEILSQPLLYLSLYFNEHKTTYYELLTEVRQNGNYEKWITFFLKGVIEVSQQVMNTTRKIINLKNRLADSFKDPYNFINFLFKKPVIKIEDVINQLNVSKKTGYNIVYEFENKGVIKEITNNKRNKRYVFDEYMQILNEKF